MDDDLVAHVMVLETAISAILAELPAGPSIVSALASEDVQQDHVVFLDPQTRRMERLYLDKLKEVAARFRATLDAAET